MSYLSKPGKKRKKNIKVPKEIYQAVYDRDNGQCVLCGYGGEAIQLHHIHFGSHIREHDIDNLCMLCESCHMDIAHKNKRKIIAMLEKYIEYTKR